MADSLPEMIISLYPVIILNPDATPSPLSLGKEKFCIKQNAWILYSQKIIYIMYLYTGVLLFCITCIFYSWLIMYVLTEYHITHHQLFFSWLIMYVLTKYHIVHHQLLGNIMQECIHISKNNWKVTLLVFYHYHHHLRTAELKGILRIIEFSCCQGSTMGELNSQPLT